jgi:hypothetical protein
MKRLLGVVVVVVALTSCDKKKELALKKSTRSGWKWRLTGK